MEQSEQWKDMARPLVERFTGERWDAERALLTLMPHEDRIDRINGLCKSGKLVRLGVPRPIWALRFAFLTWSYELFTEPWFPRFALRSATALLGLALAHPDDQARATLFQRVHVRFVRESLRPFVEWLSQLSPADDRRGNYAPLMALYQVCDDSRDPADPEKWRKFNSRLRFYDEPILESERGRCLHLTEVLFKSILIQLNLEPLLSDTERTYWRPHSVPYALHQQHQWRLEGRASDEFYSGPNCTHLIVAPFLTALEAECPPPDWLELERP